MRAGGTVEDELAAVAAHGEDALDSEQLLALLLQQRADPAVEGVQLELARRLRPDRGPIVEGCADRGDRADRGDCTRLTLSIRCACGRKEGSDGASNGSGSSGGGGWRSAGSRSRWALISKACCTGTRWRDQPGEVRSTSDDIGRDQGGDDAWPSSSESGASARRHAKTRAVGLIACAAARTARSSSAEARSTFVAPG